VTVDELSPLAPVRCEVVVIGCGNLLRGDDGVGPILVRHLWEAGVPDGLRLIDGGTAGMDAAFMMRGARRVVIVDASATGAAPGTVYRVPAAELEDLPALEGLHSHSFRWDHALSFGRWLLGDEYPDDITVFLVEAGDVSPGAELSAPVRAAMGTVQQLVTHGWIEPLRPPPEAPEAVVELTGDGYLRLDADLAALRFPADAAVAVVEGDALVLIPLRGPSAGGLILKQRTLAGDRSLLVREVLGDAVAAGRRPATWDGDRGALRVPLVAQA
jgi:hydrogenase maturation protease